MPEQRILVHAGFHKTGTSSVQRTLMSNARVLWPVMALGGRDAIRPILSAARGYSTWRDPLSLEKFRTRLDAFLAGLTLGPKRPLVLCSEEFTGHLPGRGDLASYSAAGPLMAALAEVMEARYGAGLELTLHFSTRAPAAWLESAYWEHVKSSRMTLDLVEFALRYGGAADLPRAVAEVQAAAPRARVTSAALEDTARLPFGPATPLIDAFALAPQRRALLVPHGPSNVAPHPRLLARCLELNRSPLDRAALSAAKAELLGRRQRQPA
jgi:hypothetical protein